MSTKGPTTVRPDDVRTLKNPSPDGTPAAAMHKPFISPKNIGDSNGMSIQDIQELHEAKWPQSARDEHKSNGGFFAGPGTSFPLSDATDVEHAAGLYGHADNPNQIKSKIISFAKSHGFTSSLPKEWTEDINDDMVDPPGTDDDDDDDDDGQTIRESCQIIEAVATPGPGHEVLVTSLKGGKSANGFSYDNVAYKPSQLSSRAHRLMPIIALQMW